MNMVWDGELIPPFYEVTGRMSEVDLNAPNPVAGNRPGALVFARPGQSFNNTFWKQFLPRFGGAYQVNSKLAARAGYAIMSTPPIPNNWREPPFTYHFNATTTVHPATS